MKALKILFYTLLILIGLVVAVAFIIARFYGDDIKSYVVSELNKNLTTEVDVKEIDFTILESFPLASIQFSQVVIYSSLVETDTMLHANKLSCKFNLVDLYEKKYELLEIEIRDGKCNLFLDKQGNENYIFWKKSDSSSSNFKVNLEQVDIAQMNFSYQDLSNDFVTHFEIQEAALSGSLTENISQLKIKTQLNKAFVKSGNFKALENRTVFINANGDIDQNKISISFKDANIGLADLNFILNGDINYKNETRLNLQISSKESDLEKAISILPKSISENLKDFNIKGEATIDGVISGVASSIQNPSYSFNFSLKNGFFKKQKTTVVFSNSFLEGNINNGAENRIESTEIKIEKFSTKLNTSDISGTLLIKNLKKPDYAFKGNVNFELADAMMLLEVKELDNVGGSVTSSLSLTGKLEQFEKYSLKDFKKSTVRGQVNLNELAFSIPKEKITINSMSGVLSLENANIALDNFNTIINENNIDVAGKLYNIIPFALSDQEKLICDLVLSGKSVHINDFIQAKESNKPTAFSFPKNMTLYLETKFNEVLYDNLVLEELNGDITLKNERLDLRNFKFNSQGGTVYGEYFLRKKHKDFAFYAKSRLLNIDIEEVFTSFNNFGQKTIEAENIKGRTSADITVSLLFDQFLKTQLASLKIDADLVIDNGQLNNVAALEALSDFVELEELRAIKFKTLRNQLSVKDCTLTIPKFDIQSSAMNLSVSGNHKFNNALDYHFVILLNELLGKKVKKPSNNEFGYVEDDGLGRTKIFMKMNGTSEKPAFGYDTEELKTHLNTTVEQEKKTIKKLLNQEFGFFNKDTSLKNVKTSPPPKKSPFQIEWEEEEKKKINSNIPEPKKKPEKKGKFGKFIDKIAQPNEEEFVEPIEN